MWNVTSLTLRNDVCNRLRALSIRRFLRYCLGEMPASALKSCVRRLRERFTLADTARIEIWVANNRSNILIAAATRASITRSVPGQGSSNPSDPQARHSSAVLFFKILILRAYVSGRALQQRPTVSGRKDPRASPQNFFV